MYLQSSHGLLTNFISLVNDFYFLNPHYVSGGLISDNIPV